MEVFLQWGDSFTYSGVFIFHSNPCLLSPCPFLARCCMACHQCPGHVCGCTGTAGAALTLGSGEEGLVAHSCSLFTEDTAGLSCPPVPWPRTCQSRLVLVTRTYAVHYFRKQSGDVLTTVLKLVMSYTQQFQSWGSVCRKVSWVKTVSCADGQHSGTLGTGVPDSHVCAAIHLTDCSGASKLVSED